MKSEKKKKKKKLKTRMSIERWLSRALSLAKSKSSFRTDAVLFNSETKELVATNGHCMLIVKVKPAGTLLPFNLESGLYDILDDVLLKREEEFRFPDYQGAVPKSPVVCTHNILDGILICMIKTEMFIDIWKYENILKAFNKFSSDWIFTASSKNKPVMMEASNTEYNVKYIMMPTPMQM